MCTKFRLKSGRNTNFHLSHHQCQKKRSACTRKTLIVVSPKLSETTSFQLDEPDLGIEGAIALLGRISFPP